MAPTPVPGPELVPLAVWPCAQTSAQHQRAGRYLPASGKHPGKMLPELARRILTAYSCPGDLVVDPMCGIGTTLVEGAALGRRCVGVELEPRWAALSEANLDHILPAEQRPLAEVLVGDARRLPEVLADVAGTVDLVATSPPYACDAGRIDKPAWLAGASMCDLDGLNYSTDRVNLGHARGDAYLTGMGAVYAACYAALRPGGLLVTVTKNTRRAGRLIDLAAATRRLATDAGFTYLQHVVALHAAIRDSRLVARPSFWQLTQTRKARGKGDPVHLVVHEDVLVFRKPEAAAVGERLPPSGAGRPPGAPRAQRRGRYLPESIDRSSQDAARRSPDSPSPLTPRRATRCWTRWTLATRPRRHALSTSRDAVVGTGPYRIRGCSDGRTANSDRFGLIRGCGSASVPARLQRATEYPLARQPRGANSPGAWPTPVRRD